MKEYKATLHGYEIVTPPRCKLDRLEPVTADIVLPLHYAESAPVAMRVSGPLEYTGKDGNVYTWRGEGLELLALDGMLWKRYDVERVKRWHPEPWTLEELADQCVSSSCTYKRVLTEWPFQWGDEPETHLVRDRGTRCTLENLSAEALEGCDRYAVIAGELYEPARELVYAYNRYTSWGWGRKDDGRLGSVIEAREYDPADTTRHYMCNALQDWREVNHFDKYAQRIEDKIVNEITGADFIEVLIPEYVQADPYADFWRAEVKRLEDAAAKCIESAKDSEEHARTLREVAKKERAEAKSKKEAARKTAEELEAYLNAKEA